MKPYLFFTLLLYQFAFSQSIETVKIVQNLKNGEKNWQIPLPKKQITNGIVWQERQSSLASQGIKTFVGYIENQMVGVVSIYQNAVSGSLFWQGKNYVIATKKGKISISQEKEQGSCGTCEGGHCSTHGHSPKTQTLHRTSALTQALISTEKSNSIIPSDGILRIYRLAVLVDYHYFSTFFNNDKSAVSAFLSNLEVGLNEIYMRDLGIKFEMVNHPELVRDTPEKLIHKWRTGAIINFSTLEINTILGDGDVDKGRTQYDLGISLAPSDTESGLATLFGAYKNATKAAAHSSPSLPTIAHEIGHLFGGRHTFSKGGRDGFQTEPEAGTSVMSYGIEQRDFFSLFSIELIRKELAQNASVYYTTRERNPNKMVGTPSEGQNIIFAIDTKNQPPVLDRTKIKPKYQLPPQTAFQFDIKATDPEGKPLIYWAHQTDVKAMPAVSNTRFFSKKPNSNPIKPFDPEYYANLISLQNALRSHTEFLPSDRGNFTFWIAAGNADISKGYWERENHATGIDAMAVTVEIINGTPFKLTSKVGNLDNKGNETRKYNGGQKTTLTWSVDKTIFGENSHVRILMSDDFGASWKYVLSPDTENDGSHEVIIPNIDLSQRIQHERRATSGKGLFRIEVLDHIATAMTDGGAKPVNGGFEIHPNKIQFAEKPQSVVQIKRKDLPLEVFPLKATTSCTTNSEVRITNEDKEDNNRIIRTWTAQDVCGNTAYFVQHIEIMENTPPLLWEKTLSEVKISCKNDLNSIEKPKTTGGKGNITITFEDTTPSNYCNATIVRTYTAKDEDNTTITIQQTIKIEDTILPTWENTANLPQNMTIEEGNTIPTQEELTATDNCGVATVEKTSSREGNTIIYKWKATDTCGNFIEHTQMITINPKIIVPSVPNLPTNPQNEEIIIYNGVSTQENSENYLRINDNLMLKEEISVEIFNEMGQRVYKNDNYGKNGGFFRGYANEKGVLSKEKPLPSGTYFYIMKVQDGKTPVKQGFLYVK